MVLFLQRWQPAKVGGIELPFHRVYGGDFCGAGGRLKHRLGRIKVPSVRSEFDHPFL